jgi:sigma-B regulation protein RsbU (phosphoserine phosphatase)
MSKSTPKLLLIEKDSVCAGLLSPDAYELTPAGQLAAALEKISSNAYDLILMELILPDGHGLSAFNQVRAAAPHTSLVLLVETADEEEIAARAICLGAQDFLLKPQMTAQSLSTVIRKTLDRHYCQMTHNQEGFLLQTLMDSIPDAVYFKDTRSRFLMISRALAKKHRLADPQQAIGKSDADYFTKPHAEQALADEQTILRTGQPLENIEESETWPDGSVTWVSTTKMPLRNQSGRIVGTFGISRDITTRKLAELALAERTWQLQKKNQQIEDELKMARELQLAMLPQKFPNFPQSKPADESALKFFSFFLPSGAVSGDFFNVVALSETSVGVFICDVMGHDVRAALVTAMMQSLVEDLSRTASDPGHLLTQINHSLFKVFKQSGTTMFATAFYLVADVATGKLSYASAAHPDPLQLRRHQNRVEPLGADAGCKKGPAIGLFKDSRFPTYQRQMNPDDVILLFTDGVVEAEGRDQDIFSQERLAAFVHNHSQLAVADVLAELIAELRQFSGQFEFSDDVCLVGMEVKRTGPAGSSDEI